MSFLDTITDGVSKIADTALGEGSSLLSSFNLLDNASTMIVDSMRSLPGSNELQNLGFPQFEELLNLDNMQQQFEPCSCERGFNQMNFKEFISKLFGNDSNPINDILGGQAGFDQTLQCAFDILSGNPEDILRQLGLLGGDGGGGGGFFGGIFSGIKGLLGGDKGGGLGGILGGILGGGEGGGILGGILGGGGGGLLGGILGGEGGGLLGGILGGEDGLLGGILSKIPGAETLLPLALKVAPYVLL